MISFVSCQVRFRRTGSWARAFQKFVTLSVLRVAIMSSYTARTSGLAFSYSMNPSVDMGLLRASAGSCPLFFCLPGRDAPAVLPQVYKFLKFAISICLPQSWQTRLQISAPVLRAEQHSGAGWAALGTTRLSAKARSDQKAVRPRLRRQK